MFVDTLILILFVCVPSSSHKVNEIQLFVCVCVGGGMLCIYMHTCMEIGVSGEFKV